MSPAFSQTSVPVLRTTLEEVADVFALAAPRLELHPYPDHELVFSCSRAGIWPATRRGYIQPEDRVYVQGESWLLDTIASIVVAKVNSRGGRFIIDLDRVRCTDGTVVCEVQVGA